MGTLPDDWQKGSHLIVRPFSFVATRNIVPISAVNTTDMQRSTQ